MATVNAPEGEASEPLPARGVLRTAPKLGPHPDPDQAKETPSSW